MTIRDYTMLSGQFFTTQDVDAAPKWPCSVKLSHKTCLATAIHGPGGHHQECAVHRDGRADAEGQSPTGRIRTTSSCFPISTATQKVFGANKVNAKAVASLMVQALNPQSMDQAIAR